MRQLDGKVALVTGAARGIGRSIALVLASEGADVIIADLDGSDCEAVAREAQHHTAGSRACKLDVSDVAQVDVLFREMLAQGKRLDILVNNAAVSRQVDFFDLTVEDIDTIMRVNLRGTLLMMQGAARVMRTAGTGRIVNISSIAGKGFRDASNIAYAGSKGAIVTMTRIAAARLGEYGITVNAVCPGMTETQLMIDWMERRAGDGGTTVEAFKLQMAAKTALGRINSPEDVAQSVLFLTSDAARNITGQSLNVDAGTMWD